MVLNRLANHFIRLLFGISLNDTTNAFKAYRKEVIDGCRPFIAPHFNLTIEIPLKAIVRGYSWVTIPITWRGRSTGTPKLKIKEMGSRYVFICLYVWLEKYFSRGDYRRGSRVDICAFAPRAVTNASCLACLTQILPLKIQPIETQSHRRLVAFCYPSPVSANDG